MTLELSMQHRVLEYYRVCSNDGPGLTLTYFTAMSNLVPYAFIWEKGKTMLLFFWNYCRLLFETSNRWTKWQEVSTDIKTLSTGGCMPPAPGYIHVFNHQKIVWNQTSKRFLWNLQQIGKVIRPFCWHQNFVRWGLSTPVPGLYTCFKSSKKKKKKKKMYRIRPTTFFKLATNGWSARTFLLTSKFCPLGTVWSCPGLYTCIKSWKKIDRSVKRFLLTSTFCPLGLSAPDLWLNTFIKSWQDVHNVRDWRDSF